MQPGPASPRPRIVVVDMAVTRQSPAGSCVLAEVEGLVRDHDVTVFAERIEASLRPRVDFIEVRAPWRPVVLRYAVFHLAMRWRFARWRRAGHGADVVQATQGQLAACDIAYAHFCHRAYLVDGLKKNPATGLRRCARWATHALNARAEAAAFARARVIVVPSRGLRDEIASAYPRALAKLRVIANPVDLARHCRPADFDRDGQRLALGFGSADVVIVFMALGDFARKGLGLLIEALGGSAPAVRERVRLLVVGGDPAEIADFAGLAGRAGVQARTVFVGLQAVVQPYLWAGDAFAFPSAYESFGLAAVQAAAAGLPVMAAPNLHGVEDVVVDGRNGWVVPRRVEAIGTWLAGIAGEDARLRTMGDAAAASVAGYGIERFRREWVALIDSLMPASRAAPTTATGSPAAASL